MAISLIDNFYLLLAAMWWGGFGRQDDLRFFLFNFLPLRLLSLWLLLLRLFTLDLMLIQSLNYLSRCFWLLYRFGYDCLWDFIFFLSDGSHIILHNLVNPKLDVILLNFYIISIQYWV